MAVGWIRPLGFGVVLATFAGAAEPAGQTAALPFADRFPGSAPQSHWRIASGTWTVADGILRGGQGSLAHFAWTGGPAWTDYAVETQVRMAGSSEAHIDWLKAYVFVRVRDEHSFYRFGVHGDGKSLDLYRCQNDVWTSLGGKPFTAEKNRWYTLRVEARGPRLACFVDGTLMLESRDAAFAAGGVGLGVLEDHMVTEWRELRVESVQKTGKLAVELFPYLLTRQVVVVQVDVSDLPGDPGTRRGKVALRPAAGGAALATRPVTAFDASGLAEVELSVAGLPGGACRLSVEVTDAAGQAAVTAERELALPPPPPWRGSQAGVSDAVLPPWTPLEVVPGVNPVVRCIGRDYTFDGNGLPQQLAAAGRPLLVRPAALVARVAGQDLAWQAGAAAVAEATAARVALTGRAQAGDLRLETHTTVEYDGMARVDLALSATRSLTLDGLRLEFPLAPAQATLFHYWPGQWGSARNSGALPADGLSLPFRPFVWLGNEDGGLGWFAESAQGWANADPKAVIAVRREGDAVLLRVSLVDQPVELQPDAPLTLTVGFQATPVKPIPRDWHELRVSHSGSYDLVDRPFRPDGSLLYPAAGHLDPRQGTLEAWVVPTFDSQVAVDPQAASRGLLNREFVQVAAPDGRLVASLYWNIDDRGMRFYVRRDGTVATLLGSHSEWKPGEAHHVAFSWGREVRIFVDGQSIASQPWPGLFGDAEAPLPPGAVIRFGGGRSDFVVGRLRISKVARERFDLTQPPAADADTLLLDILGETFAPDGQRQTQPVRSAKPGAGGLPSEHTRFTDTPFGRGLALFAAGEDLNALDRLASLGAKTIVFHEHWTDVQNYSMVGHDAELRRLVAECHKRGLRLIVYFGYELSSIAPEWNAYGHECLVKEPTVPLPTTGYPRQPEQHANIVCYNSPWQDFVADAIQRTVTEYGLDGVYLDGTIEPWGCPNSLHGCGYRARDGSWQPTYPMFAVRNLMKRIYTICTGVGGIVNPHQSTCCTSPTLAFSHSYWDGEQFGDGQLAGDPLTLLPLETFRAEFMGRNWGVPAEFLVYERPPAWRTDDALAFTLLHDVCVRPGSIEATERIAPIWDVWTHFGVAAEDCRWYPYWSNAGQVRATPESVKVSLYSRGAKGLLAVVSNLGSAEVQAGVRFEWAALGLDPAQARARDALTGEALPLVDGELRSPLPRMRMRLVEVHGEEAGRR